jgi:hypothetical protein
VAAALPLKAQSFGMRSVRAHPRLTHDPDPKLTTRARSFLIFLNGVRGAAAQLGFGAAWTKTVDNIKARLDIYTEDLLEKLHAPAADDDVGRVRQFLDIATEFIVLAADEKSAQIVRRRIAAA